MSVKASQQLLLRRYAYDSVQTIYNNTNKTLPESVQNKINQIKEELEMIYKESEKKNKRHQFKKHNGIHRRSVQNSVISRNQPAKLDQFSVFKKKYNLLLNSLIETNVDDVSSRILKLIRLQISQLAKQGTKINDDSTEETNDFQKYILHITNQLIDNAVLQPIYSKSYVSVLYKICSVMIEEQHIHLRTAILKVLTSSVNRLDSASLNNMNAKGYGKLVTELYIQKMFSQEQYISFLQKWISAFSTNEHSICELLVQMCMTLAEENQLKSKWKLFVKEHIQPLWENESVSMRAKIRMWDIRDAYQ